MEAELIWNDDQDGPVKMSPSEIRVYWPQRVWPPRDDGETFCVRLVVEEGELQVLVNSDAQEGTECVWSAVTP